MRSALYEAALRDALTEARQRHVPFECIVGETEPDMENRLNEQGRNRLYYVREPDGAIVEVPYESPPEDESKQGVPLQLMSRFFNDSTKMTGERLVALVETILNEYARPEFFTPEYLEFAKNWYNKFAAPEDRDTSIINYASAKEHYAGYQKIVGAILDKFKNSLAEVKEVFPLSRQQREELQQQGRTFIEWSGEEE